MIQLTNSHIVFDKVDLTTKQILIHSVGTWQNRLRDRSLYRLGDYFIAPNSNTSSMLLRKTTDTINLGPCKIMVLELCNTSSLILLGKVILVWSNQNLTTGKCSNFADIQHRAFDNNVSSLPPFLKSWTNHNVQNDSVKFTMRYCTQWIDIQQVIWFGTPQSWQRGHDNRKYHIVAWRCEDVVGQG